MKSIFLGSAVIEEVYSRRTRELLRAEEGITPALATKEDILAHPEKYSDTEYIFSTWGMPRFTESEITRYLPALKALFYGAGSVRYFAQEFLNRGIRVFSAWGANAVPVAEYTAAQIILANKGFYLASRRYASPGARKEAVAYFRSMPGNYQVNVGIIGAGMIGKLVIKLLKQYEIRVLVYDPFLSPEQAEELGVERVSLEELFSGCQTISNHVANLPRTAGMLHYGLFRRMKKNAVFINTGRGAQVVEKDLIRILREEPDITAVLDVTDPEPPMQGSELYTMENVILTPHIAGSAGQEPARMGEYMAEQFQKYRRQELCEYEVTLKILETMA